VNCFPLCLSPSWASRVPWHRGGLSHSNGVTDNEGSVSTIFLSEWLSAVPVLRSPQQGHNPTLCPHHFYPLRHRSRHLVRQTRIATGSLEIKSGKRLCPLTALSHLLRRHLQQYPTIDSVAGPGRDRLQFISIALDADTITSRSVSSNEN
jgi:hypothetical protein